MRALWRCGCFGQPLAAAAVGVFLLIGPPGHAQTPKAPEALDWSKAETSNFEKNLKNKKLDKQPRTNLSGAACAPTEPKFTWCLIVNDEKNYGQFFSINGTTITPGKLILLSTDEDEVDAEGAAYDAGYFYVTGSHGRSRHNDNDNDSSYVVFRFPFDATKGKLPFEPVEDKVVGVESSGRLRDALAKSQYIGPYYNKALNKDGGINIEGIAVRNKRMLLGLRGPSSKEGDAYVLDVDAEALFTKTGDLGATVKPVRLGENTGIRDLAAVKNGILILAGPTRDEAVPYSVWLWDGASTSAKPLATLDLGTASKDEKAEILLLLEEKDDALRVLVMSDGIENGGPRSFLFKK